MTEREINDRISSYKEACKEAGGEIPVPDADVDAFFQNDGENNIPSDYRDAFQRARNGDFSQFDTLPLFLRNVLGATEVRQFKQHFGSNPSFEDDRVKSYIAERAMNAAFRAGMFTLKKSQSEEERAIGETCDKIASYSIMQRTMLPPTEQETQEFTRTVGDNNAPAELQRNLARQRVMAKMFLLGQLGKYEVLDKGKATTDLNETIAETLAHGGRTNYILPNGEDTQQVFDAFLGEGRGTNAGVYKRSAATHYVSRRKIKKDGTISSQSKEQKLYINPVKIMSNQNGMDLAVGGIGAKGPGGTPITGRGESGHAYMRIENGDKKHCASLLFGIEGCAPQSSSNLGSTHGIRAIPGKQSAFISGKGAVGKKLGGRQVDLSGLSSQELAGILNTFDQKYTELQNNANTPEGREKLAKYNDMLMGKPMETDKLLSMFEELGMGSEQLTNSVNKARSGYSAKLDLTKMTKEDYQQNIRKAYSTKDACKLAEARFESAGDNIELAVGAIKELMYTHATRSSNYFWRHPIKNYQENSTISSLLKKLETEKHFSRADIVAELVSSKDSFAFDWGKGLSNDSRDLKFIKENNYDFMLTQSKLSSVRVDACKKYYKDINVLRDNAAFEQQQMKDELKEILPEDHERFELLGKGKIPSDTTREKFSCLEAYESISSNNSISEKVEAKPDVHKEKHP